MSVCTFFGHRDCSDEIETVLCACIEKLICEKDVDTFYVGNQGDFDAIVYKVLKKLHKKYPYIQCNIVLAYLRDKHEGCEFETVYPEGTENVPQRFAIDYRNKWMIKNSEYVICYVKYSFGGANKYLKLAERQRKIIINLFSK